MTADHPTVWVVRQDPLNARPTTLVYAGEDSARNAFVAILDERCDGDASGYLDERGREVDPDTSTTAKSPFGGWTLTIEPAPLVEDDPAG